MSGTLVHIKSGGDKEEIHWPEGRLPDIKILQRLVGGWVERLKVRYEGRVRDAFVNEEGIRMRLPENAIASSILQRTYPGRETQKLYGDFVVWVPTPRKEKMNVVVNASN